MPEKLIHRVWLDDLMPDEFARYGERWAELHPDWHVRDWMRSDELPRLRCQDLFDAAPRMVPNDWKRLQSDIVRLELLYQFGGIYADTDVEPLKPLDDLIDGVPAWAPWEAQGRWVGQFIMGCEAGHPFFRRLLDGLPAHVEANLGGPVALLSGPRYVTPVYRRRPDELHVFDQRYFTPYSFDELHRADAEFPEAYCIHRWSNRRSGRDSHGRRMK